MTASASHFVLDVGSLESMKRRTREAPLHAQKDVARQFEALFLQMMVKRMREATPKDGIFDSDQSRMMQSLMDEQIAQSLADPGIGLAKALLAQMTRGQAALQAAVDAQPGAQEDAPDAYFGEFRPLASPMTVYDGQRVANAASWSTGAFTRAEGAAGGNVLGAIRAGMQETARQAARVAGRAAEAPDHVEAFMSRIADSAHAVAEASGLPVRLILGQAALESGWGRREIVMADGRTSHNLFGIKATGNWNGKVAKVLTTEYEGGVARKVVQPFRAYDSYEEALADYARLITQSPRYERVLGAADERDAARRIQAAGYATDPAYADKLIKVMDMLPV